MGRGWRDDSLPETTHAVDLLLEYLEPRMRFYLALKALDASFVEYMDSSIDRTDVLEQCDEYDMAHPPQIDYNELTGDAINHIICTADIDVALNSQQPLVLECFADRNLCEFEITEIRPVCTACLIDQI